MHRKFIGKARLRAGKREKVGKGKRCQEKVRKGVSACIQEKVEKVSGKGVSACIHEQTT